MTTNCHCTSSSWCWLWAGILAGVFGQDAHLWPLHLAWAVSQHSGWVPRASIRRGKTSPESSVFFSNLVLEVQQCLFHHTIVMKVVLETCPRSRGGNLKFTFSCWGSKVMDKHMDLVWPFLVKTICTEAIISGVEIQVQMGSRQKRKWGK